MSANAKNSLSCEQGGVMALHHFPTCGKEEMDTTSYVHSCSTKCKNKVSILYCILCGK